MIGALLMLASVVGVLGLVARPSLHHFSPRLAKTKVRSLSGQNLALVLATLEIASLTTQIVSSGAHHTSAPLVAALVGCGAVLVVGLVLAPAFAVRSIAIGGTVAFLVTSFARVGATSTIEFALAAVVLWIAVSITRGFAG